MSTDKVIIAELREEHGSNAARRLRSVGILPAIINDVEGTSVPIKFDLHAFEMLLRHHRGDNLMVDIKIGDEKVAKVLLSEVQYDTVTNKVVHADFREVSLTEKIHLSVEIELIGEAEGVKAGGVLEHLLRDVEIECLPTDIVESLKLDVSALEIGDTLTVADIKLDNTITILTNAAIPIAAVAVPKTEEAEEAEGEAVVAEGDEEAAAEESGDDSEK
jgi:large subunit ribosomal protein L25